MAIKYDVIHGQAGKDGKTWWTKVGRALPAKDGADGFSIQLNYVPTNINPESGLWLQVKPAEEKAQRSNKAPWE